MESCGCLSSIANSLCGTKSTQRAKYNEQDYTIEFENLIEEEDFYTPSQHVVSDVEKDLLSKGKYGELYEHQKMIGERQEELLRQQEEDVRLEDEAYIQAKKEAAKSRKLKQPLEKGALMKARMNNSVEFSKWLAEEQIDVTSPNLDIEDFDAFLEKVKAKSARNNIHTLGAEDENERFEQTLKRGLEATIIAGDALNALHPVELHAVSSQSSTINPSFQDESYGRPFTPDLSSIASTNSDPTISSMNTPSKDNSSRTNDSLDTRTDISFSSAVSTQHSRDQSFDMEATPTNTSNGTFVVDKTPTASHDESSLPLPQKPVNASTTSTTKALITTPRNVASNLTPKEQQITNNSITDSSPGSAVSSFKMVNSKDDSQSFDNSAFLDDTDNKTKEDDDDDDDFGDFGDEDFGDFGDDDFVSAEGGFEELLV